MNQYLRFLLLLFVLFSHSVYAASLYGGAGYTYNVLSSDIDFWNGGDGVDPYFVIGTKINKLSLELTYRSLEIENIHTTASGTYDILITDNLITLGSRLDLSRFTHANFGIVKHSVDISYTTNSTATLNKNSIAGDSFSLFVGGGFHGSLFLPNLSYIVDFNYYHRSSKFGLFSIETGIFYNFYNF
ncbi:hypothetical protein [Halobacteriovorax sp.]|uniref:hypothetical protein n=1 Tax=Halobacteriovorax sp. TaxID=2020862 RepID=UPI003562C6BB